MEFEYDEDVDAAYIYLEHPIKEGAVKKTVELKNNVILDYDKDNRLIGIEIMDASKTIKRQVLKSNLKKEQLVKTEDVL